MSEKSPQGHGWTVIIVHKGTTFGIDPWRLVVWLVVIFILAVSFVVLWQRPYYRYGGGKVWLEKNPDAAWNGLLSPPVFQIIMPHFVRARSWSPNPDRVRQELLKSYPRMTDDEIAPIIRACVPIESVMQQHPKEGSP